jgi:AAA+ superfamily predicted ATPase
VYFFDEFDAIGSHRGLTHDAGEIRRVLNSFLQMIEHDQSNSLIVAATNHPEILDYALFRRFDDVIEYHLPTPEQAAELIRSRLAQFGSKRIALKALAAHAQGLSYAEIRRAVDESIKDVVMQGGDRVSAEVLARALQERHRLSQKLEQKNKPNHGGSNGR